MSVPCPLMLMGAVGEECECGCGGIPLVAGRCGEVKGGGDDERNLLEKRES